MTVANQQTTQTYNGDGNTTDFAIVFDLMEGDRDHVKVILIDLDGTPIPQVESTHYEFDNVLNPTRVEMIVAPTVGQKLIVKRVSPKVQDTNLLDGVPFPGETVEKQLDRHTFILQEICRDIDEIESDVSNPSNTVSAGAVAVDFESQIQYSEGQLIIVEDRIYRATTDFTSDTPESDIVNGLLNLLQTQGIQGPAGNTGMMGPQGIQGPQGPAGVNGGNGADGLITAIASQAEAEAGVENTKAMTALRTSQAIAAQVPNLPVITAVVDKAAENMGRLDNLDLELERIENLVETKTGRSAGSQKIRNSQVVPLALLGKFAPDTFDRGRGSRLLRDGDGTEFAEAKVYIRRQTDDAADGFRFISFKLIFHYIASKNEWFIQRGDTELLDQSLELEGVMLSIVTDPATKEGQVFYMSDLMPGNGHDDDIGTAPASVIKWLIQEISIGV